MRKEFRIRNSPSYIAQCRVIDKENEEGLLVAKEQYQRAIKYFNEILKPDYEKKKKTWARDHSQRIIEANSKLSEIENKLNELYADSAAVPTQYRNRRSLKMIVNYARQTHLELNMPDAVKGFAKLDYRSACEQRDRLYEAAREAEQRREEERLRREEEARARAMMRAEKSAQRKRKFENEKRRRKREAAEMQRKIASFEESRRYNYMRDQIIKNNQKRSRKGQPELPVPPWRE